MTPQEQTLQSRITNSAHRDAVRNIFGLASRLNAERAKLKADASLSDIGREEKAAAFAKSLVKTLSELTRPARRAKADVAAKRAAFKLPEIDKTDLVGELRRAEIRGFLRPLSLDERTRAAATDDEIAEAVLNASPMLSGLPIDRYERIKNAYLEKKFGPQIQALEAADEEHEAVEAAATMTRRELLNASGMSANDFAALEKSHET